MKVTICIRIPINAYMGGMATLANQYIENSQLFKNENVNISLFNYHDLKVEKIKNSKLRNILYWASCWRESIRYCKIHEPDLFHIHTAREFSFLRDVMIGGSIAKKTRSKCALTIHVGAIETVFNRIPKWTHRYIVNCLNKYFSKVFFLSKTLAESFVSIGVKSEICFVLYNFHEMPIIVEDKTQNTDRINFLFVGAIQREKGILELIDAFETIKSYRRVHLDICGLVNDPTIENTFNTFLENNKDCVTAHGYVYKDNKEHLFRKADVLVLPSYHEGMPLVILEGIASGCAVITTKVGAIPEVLSSENALWVDIGDSISLRDAMLEIIDDSTKRQNMQRINSDLSKSFTIEEHIKTLCSVYKDIQN